tara:strand:- start:387 stop:1253 length:867 start_codon:yes stop_codon:yes gene_type:complete
MSGPKCTSYQLQQQRIRELERKRLQQEKQKNLQLLSALKQRINIHQYLLQTQKEELFVGIQDAERETQEDKYLVARKKIQGIELYFDAIERNQQRALDKVASERLMAEAMPTEKKQLLLNEINTIKGYKDIMDKAIDQRVNLYSGLVHESIQTNTDITVKDERNIRLFIDQVDELKSDYDKEMAEREYVRNVLGEIIGAKNVKGSNNLSGSIGGTPVNVNFGDGGEIIFDISDENRDCHGVLDTINNNLKEKQINLDDVYIENTGKTIRLNEPKQTNVQSQSNKTIQR